MASPWKFLARLVSPGREQKRKNGSTEKVSPEALPSSGPTETPAEDSLNSDGRPAGAELPRHGQPGAISLKPVHSEEAESDVHDKVDGEVAEIVEVADPAMSGGTGFDVTAANDAARLKRIAESHRASKGAAARKRWRLQTIPNLSKLQTG
ncbi:UNVERIFIED_ORG: hypothetical protein GGI57_005804 [Rhizobium aethiopicum]|nr:hypothetical protein AMK05_PC00037 [Rhizobium sp. N324]ANM19941.1 hypothetical protein AMK06_PC100029 [Rhizobium sp. N541]ANM26326.1 hypothetical protein AMK07_PC100029 [Rhizobium sp. N941]OYD00586.1 hypothetical protein AMK08_PC00037 [Rhizobium sp. N4311]